MRLSSLLVSILPLFFLIIHSFISPVESKSALEELDADFWKGVNKLCVALVNRTDLHTSQSDTYNLRLIQFTKFSFKTHSMYPSAAKSLLASSHFDKNLPTVLFAHGFTDDPLLFAGQTFAAAFKKRGGYNILALDSSKLIKMLYARSSILVKYIGEALGVVLHELVANGVNPQDIHIIGHSLGAHICGFAGKAFKELNPDSPLPRITGLDPAGPCFAGLDASERIDRNDAKFVDIIHTNKGVYGLNETIGTVDFWPNGGGLQQPGCIESVCSHNKVWSIFDDSVNRPDTFVASKCASWEVFKTGACDNNNKALMGYGTTSNVTGDYFLRTHFAKHYGMGYQGSLAK